MDEKKALVGVSDQWRALLLPGLPAVFSQLDEQDITPGLDKIFEFARLTDLRDVKVVILGQDPYPTPGFAHGLAFSCLGAVPGSLKNIYKCLLKHGLLKEMPTSGDLTAWARRGVLLLNAALTTKPGKAGAHIKLWSEYTNSLIKRLSEQGLVFMLWGNFAQAKKAFIDPVSTVLEFTHPSPLAQSKQSFLECDHFTKVSIDWSVDSVGEMSVVDQRFSMKPGRVVIFTDGSAFPNNTSKESRAGYAAVFARGEFKDTILFGNIPVDQAYATNNRAEGLAIIKSLEYLRERLDSWSSCVLVSDSEFWIKMIEFYMPDWSRKSIDFQTKKNPDLTVRLYNLYNELIDAGKTIELLHVRAHGRNGWDKYPEHTYEYFCYYENDYADRLAGFARTSLTPGEDRVSVVEYQ